MQSNTILVILIIYRTYNQPDTIYYRCANELDKYIAPYLNTLKDEVNTDGGKRVSGINKKIKKK